MADPVRIDTRVFMKLHILSQSGRGGAGGHRRRSKGRVGQTKVGGSVYASACVACVLLGGMVAPPVVAQVDQTNSPVVVLETTFGPLTLTLDAQRAPRTTANFLRYVRAGLYDGGSFYRSVRDDNQPDDDVRIAVVQGGIDRARRDEAFEPIEMEGTGSTGLRHLDGTLSMARGGPHTARGEFFISIGPQPELDEGGKRNPDGFGFAAFGRVSRGMEIVRRIHAAGTDGQRLDEPVRIRSARVVESSGGMHMQRTTTGPSARDTSTTLLRTIGAPDSSLLRTPGTISLRSTRSFSTTTPTTGRTSSTKRRYYGYGWEVQRTFLAGSEVGWGTR